MILVKSPKDMVEVEQLSAKIVSFVWKLHYYNRIILESVAPCFKISDLLLLRLHNTLQITHYLEFYLLTPRQL